MVITKEKKDDIKKMIEDNKWRGVIACGNLSAALSYLNLPVWKQYISEVFIIGGKTLFEEGIQLKQCESIFVTKINKPYKTDSGLFLEGYYR